MRLITPDVFTVLQRMGWRMKGETYVKYDANEKIIARKCDPVWDADLKAAFAEVDQNPSKNVSEFHD